MLSMRPDGHLPGMSHSHRWQVQHPPYHSSTFASQTRVFRDRVTSPTCPVIKGLPYLLTLINTFTGWFPTPGNHRYRGSCTPGTRHPSVWHAVSLSSWVVMLVSPLQGQGHIYSFIWLIHPCLFCTIRAHLCFILFPTASHGHRVGVNNLFSFFS